MQHRRALVRCSQRTNRPITIAPPAVIAPMISGGAPAERVPTHEAPDDPEQAGAGRAQRPRQVELVPRPAQGSPFEAQQDERHEHDPDRHVEPEDPLPRDAGDDGAADERAERDRESRDPAPRAEREAAAVRGHGGREDGQRQRHHDRAADALERAGGVERADRRRKRRCGRGRGEERQPDREQPAAAEAVTEGSAGQQEDGEGECVGVHRPLEAVEAGAEVLVDDRERGRDDEVVEGDHESGKRREHEGPDHLLLVSYVTHHLPPREKKLDLCFLTRLEQAERPRIGFLADLSHRGEHVFSGASRSRRTSRSPPPASAPETRSA